MFHGGGGRFLSWVSIFSCVLQCPLQLDSVELFMKLEHLFRIWLMHTEQTFGQPNCNMFFGTVSLFLCFHWSAGFRLFPFLVTSSHMAPSLDTVTNIFHDNASMNFHLPVRACVDVCVPSPVRWFPFVHTVIRLLRLHAICQAINKVTQIQHYF